MILSQSPVHFIGAGSATWERGNPKFRHSVNSVKIQAQWVPDFNICVDEVFRIPSPRHGLAAQPQSRRMSASASSLAAELQQAPALFENYLARFFQENAERYAYGDLFEPLYLDMTEFVTRRGKRIRPMLMLGSYRIFGGDRRFDDRS